MVEQSGKEILQRITLCAANNSLGLEEAGNIAVEYNVPLREIELLALKHSIVPTRFKRNSLSCHEQLRLFQSRVAIIGCGGLGGRTAELLTRLGIGHLLLTDPDSFSESNLNRQIFSNPQNIGYSKVAILAEELKKINPALTITPANTLFNEQSITAAHVVIDGLDSPEARRELSQLCHKKQIPLIHGAVREWYGQAGIDISSNNLIGTLYHHRNHSPSPPETKVFAMNVALIASIQSAEATKILLGYSSPLQKSWLQTDQLNCEYETIPLP